MAMLNCQRVQYPDVLRDTVMGPTGRTQIKPRFNNKGQSNRQPAIGKARPIPQRLKGQHLQRDAATAQRIDCHASPVTGPASDHN